MAGIALGPSRHLYNLLGDDGILPEHLRDYLFLHELVHTRVSGYGDDFWQELDNYTEVKTQKLEQEMHRFI